MLPTTRFVPTGPPTESGRDLFVSDLIEQGSGGWNHHMVEVTFPELASQIYLIKTSTCNAEDTFCWHKTKTGGLQC
uniref:Uncharacterized protein n=1 Tax=Brassica campestris TaxID=3711 RepID=A0A3P5YHQ1_BRACM|nr:unnamed protein product [Brassica rapa]